MKFVEKPFTVEEISDLKEQFGEYLKITADIESGSVVVGCNLHADGEKILLEHGCRQENIWGGGIDLKNKEIDTTAVLNYRPNLSNNSMDILDPKIREKFISVVKNIFNTLWN